ncbi:MAG: hypothetical protein N3B21_18695 [Clostridia bacterium]|nr:hypothetical protein [Clostridia bacterium]
MRNRNKTVLDLMQEVRGAWVINPRTRIHDNDIKRNKKKDRIKGKKASKEALKEYR